MYTGALAEVAAAADGSTVALAEDGGRETTLPTAEVPLAADGRPRSARKPPAPASAIDTAATVTTIGTLDRRGTCDP